jgi:hypothetical protein
MGPRTRGALGQAISVAVLFILSVTPAFAAQKVEADRGTNFSLPLEEVFEELPETICGVEGPFTGELRFGVFHFTLWDNGHFVFATTNSVTLFDVEGNLILRDRFTLRETGAIDSLPSTFGVAVTSHCTRNSATPGKLYQTHFTLTVGKDGVLKQVHGQACDPSVYPFC